MAHANGEGRNGYQPRSNATRHLCDLGVVLLSDNQSENSIAAAWAFRNIYLLDLMLWIKPRRLMYWSSFGELGTEECATTELNADTRLCRRFMMGKPR